MVVNDLLKGLQCFLCRLSKFLRPGRVGGVVRYEIYHDVAALHQGGDNVGFGKGGDSGSSKTGVLKTRTDDLGSRQVGKPRVGDAMINKILSGLVSCFTKKQTQKKNLFVISSQPKEWPSFCSSSSFARWDIFYSYMFPSSLNTPEFHAIST